MEYTSTANFIRQTLIGRAGSLYARAYNVNESTFSSWEKYITSTEFSALEDRVAALENGSGGGTKAGPALGYTNSQMLATVAGTATKIEEE